MKTLKQIQEENKKPMKKYNLEEIKNKYPDYKEYVEVLKKMKFKKIDSYSDEGYYIFIGVEGESKTYINSNVEKFLDSKFIPEYNVKNGILQNFTPQEYDLKCKNYLNKLPDFLNFLIKQL